MIKTLKRKFMTAIMAIITVMLTAIFSLLIYFTYSKTKTDSLRNMREMTQMFAMPGMPMMQPEGGTGMPRNSSARQPQSGSGMKDENTWKPIFTVVEAADGSLSAYGGSDHDLKDQDFLQELVDTVKASDDTDGTIKGYHLRWIKAQRARLQVYTFADITSEEKMLHGLVMSCIGIGIAAEIVFFLLSLLLVSHMVKPTAEAVKRQREFISDASHELKTPLTVIMTNAEMLTEDKFDSEQKRTFTQNILKMSGKMRGLVEGMLELARMDQRSSADAFQPVDLTALTADSVMTFEPLYFENNRTLLSEIADGVQVSGDEEKLRQVIGILLDNALKYSDADSAVTVQLRKSAGRCMLSVSSRGTPLSKEDCVNVFKRFYRVDKSRNDRSSYGLGLSIAESIVNEHHGEISAESTADGNVFTVTLNCCK